MPKTYTPLTTVSLHSGVTYLHPLEPQELVRWEDPALHAMVDFKHVKAETIGPDESIDKALIAIKNCGFHVLLVVNAEHAVLGLVSAEDLLGEKPLKAIEHRRLARADISVSMVMIPQRDILSIDLEHLRHAKVGHVVQTLRTHKQHYALVVKHDEDTGTQSVRGLFSSPLISKQLGIDVMSDLSEAHSIAELQHNLHLHD
jgi:CBS domain-containing protein